MVWFIALPSSVINSLLVVAVELPALLLLEVSISSVSRFLIARDVYDKHRSVRVSNVWFELLTGRSHGPLWFRKMCVVSKLLLLVCSIVLGLSVNGDIRPIEVHSPGPVIIAPKTRRVATLGIGDGDRNFSRELLFARAAFHCRANFAQNVFFHKSRTLVDNEPEYAPIPDKFSDPLQCLREKSGFKEEVLLKVERRSWNFSECAFSLPRLSNIRNGSAKLRVADCAWNLSAMRCSALGAGSCVALLRNGSAEALAVVSYGSREMARGASISSHIAWERRDMETLSIMAQLVDHGIAFGPLELDFISFFQGVGGDVVELKGNRLVTEVYHEPFLCALAVLGVLVGLSLCVACISKLNMYHKRRSKYVLANTLAQVARLATIGRGPVCSDSSDEVFRENDRNTLYLKLHYSRPSLTVGFSAEQVGSWTESEILNKTW